MLRRFARYLLSIHPVVSFLVMLLSVALFGISSYNLVMRLNVNIDLVSRHGWRALNDGALAEFAQLFCYGVVSLLLYILFKAAEKSLVEGVFATGKKKSGKRRK